MPKQRITYVAPATHGPIEDQKSRDSTVHRYRRERFRSGVREPLR